MLKVSEMPRSVDSYNAYFGDKVIRGYFCSPFKTFVKQYNSIILPSFLQGFPLCQSYYLFHMYSPIGFGAHTADVSIPF